MPQFPSATNFQDRFYNVLLWFKKVGGGIGATLAQRSLLAILGNYVCARDHALVSLE